MAEARFDSKLFNRLKDVLLRLHHGKSSETVQVDFLQAFNDVPVVEILLIAHELKSGDDGITSKDIKKLFSMYRNIFGYSVEELYATEIQQVGHPVQILKQKTRHFNWRLNK